MYDEGKGHHDDRGIETGRRNGSGRAACTLGGRRDPIVRYGAGVVIDTVTSVATTVAAAGCGLTAGVMLAFSVSVMPALSTRPAPDAIAAMQQMNVAIVSPIFLTVFLGGAAAALTAATSAVISGNESRTLIVVGAALFVIGCVAITLGVNVPLNDSLAVADPSSTSGADLWTSYLATWTRWNHVRTAAATTACVLLTVAAAR